MDRLRNIYLEVGKFECGDIYPGMAYQCYRDPERSLALMEKVFAGVKSGMRGVDLGAGTGILGLAALEAGADHVCFVEQNKGLCDRLQRFLHFRGLDSRTEVVQRDVKSDWNGKTDLDFVIAELISTGLLDSGEPFVESMEKIRPAASDAIYFPQSVKSYVALLNSVCQNATDEVVYDELFATEIRKKVDAKISLTALEDANVPAAKIISTLTFNDGSEIGPFPTLGFRTPVRILNFLNLDIEKGQKVDLKIDYLYGKGREQAGFRIVT